MYAIFIWISLGITYGIISKLINLKNNYGLLPTIIIGIVGAVVGGYIGRIFLKIMHHNNLLHYNNLIMPFIGSILLLYYFNFLANEAKTPNRKTEH